MMENNNALAEMFAAAGMTEPEWIKNQKEPEPMKKYIVRINDGYENGERTGSMWEDFDSVHECIKYIAQHCENDSSYDIEEYNTHKTIMYHKFDYDEDVVYEKIGDVLDCFRD